MEEAEILIDAVLVAGAEVEDVERGVEEEGKFEVGAFLGGVRGVERYVEGVVLEGCE